MDSMAGNMTARIIGVIAHPQVEWRRIRTQPPPLRDVLLRHALPLCLVPGLAAGIGALTGAVAMPLEGPAIEPLRLAVFASLCATAGLAVLVAVFRVLATLFVPAPRWSDAFRLAAYGSTPLLLGSAFMAVPAMAMVPLIGALHSCYLYYGGAHTLFGIAEDDCAEFVALSALGSGAALFLLGAAAGSYAVL